MLWERKKGMDYHSLNDALLERSIPIGIASDPAAFMVLAIA
ncbi:hypothetical protein [Butyricicoccus pullicaecorum]|nr:hypothetical protein [Butyricicoccus pullicaecorum]